MVICIDSLSGFFRNVCGTVDEVEALLGAGKEGRASNPFEYTDVMQLCFWLRTACDEDVERRNSQQASALLEHPQLLRWLPTLVGSSAKRAYLEISYMYYASPTDRFSSLRSIETALEQKHDVRLANVCSQFLQRQDSYTSVGKLAIACSTMETWSLLVDRLCGSEASGRKAKLRGHAVESHLANVLKGLLHDTVYVVHSASDMGKDPNLKGDDGIMYSFDVVIMDATGEPRVGLQSMFHLSGLGSYGVEKLKRSVSIMHKFPTVEMWMLADGIGYIEHQRQLDDVLLNAARAGTCQCILQLKLAEEQMRGRLIAMGICI
jgi:hypothetical protein